MMNKRCLHFLLATAMALCAGVAMAAAAGRYRIAEAKAGVEARYRTTEADCRQRFVVMSCIDDAKALRRKDLAALREEELIIDDADRKQRAAARREAIAEKNVGAAQRAASANVVAPKPSSPRSPKTPASESPPAAAPHAAPRPLDGGPAQAAERAATKNKRQLEVDARQVRIDERQKKRAVEQAGNVAAAKKAAPLPAAGAASAVIRPQ